MIPGFVVIAIPVVWVAAFRWSRGSWRFRSTGGIDALARNVSLITANVSVIVVNVTLIVAVRIMEVAA